MGIRLSEDEAWAFIEGSHTAIVTTLRRDGSPIALPIWFATEGHRIYVGTPVGSKKVLRVAHDDRASFLVESGDAWAELSAVHLSVTAVILDHDTDAAEISRANALLDDKYAAFRPASARLPSSASKHYASMAMLRLDPVGKALTWDNARMFPPSN